MRVLSSRRSAALAAAGAGAISCVVLTAAVGAQPPKRQDGPTARERYKNIQVLKNLPADELLPVMHNWSQSLGVRCDFCHVVETGANGQHTGFEKDTKPEKKVAREMVVMATGLNSRYRVVDRKVTCFTCHHGHAMPESKPPAAEERR